MESLTRNTDISLFIDILADMIYRYLQTSETANEADKLVPQSQPDAA
ncbi:hypothetical protein G9G63_14680 [Paenibacillus sp. EKM202P]|nr:MULTISPECIES: hypothetical protein [unclassified Paenibacillus]KAF6563432.1 hypothetical protein G9G63_14680 [Paenibacillus sp. EKM202P]KAF6569972.1 hypothetical protein G9G64_10195 [Paenibacillus sp. EKM207P]